MNKKKKVIIVIVALIVVAAALYYFMGSKKTRVLRALKSKTWSEGANTGYERYFASVDDDGNISHTPDYSTTAHVGKLINDSTIQWTNPVTGSTFTWTGS
jgi:hypothetical protein